MVCHHLACAIQEAGDEDALPTDVLGEHIARGLELRKSGRLGDEVFYSSDPHVRTPVRNGSTQNYRLVLDGEAIGSIDPWHLIREAYLQAIYLHGGRRYRVTDIFRSQLEVRLVPEKSRNFTQPHINKKVHTRRPRAVRETHEIVITNKCPSFGDTLLNSRVAPSGSLLHLYSWPGARLSARERTSKQRFRSAHEGRVTRGRPVCS